MSIEIKKSKKPVKYESAIKLMEKRLLDIHEKKFRELIWILEHNHVYTAGTSYKENEILDKSIKVLKIYLAKKLVVFSKQEIELIAILVFGSQKRQLLHREMQ